MNKLFIIFTGLMVTAFGAQAQYVNPNQPTMTVAEVLTMRDDTPVVLTGKIDNALGDEKYQFTDGTGSIVIEVDDDSWRNVQITPNDTVQIRGDVDKGWFSTEIDVDEVIKQ